MKDRELYNEVEMEGNGDENAEMEDALPSHVTGSALLPEP